MGAGGRWRKNSVGELPKRDEKYDLYRDVFGVLGILLDAFDLDELQCRIGAAVTNRRPFRLSTPNVNLLMLSRSDEAFRESFSATAAP